MRHIIERVYFNTLLAAVHLISIADIPETTHEKTPESFAKRIVSERSHIMHENRSGEREGSGINKSSLLFYYAIAYLLKKPACVCFQRNIMYKNFAWYTTCILHSLNFNGDKTEKLMKTKTHFSGGIVNVSITLLRRNILEASLAWLGYWHAFIAGIPKTF